MGGTNSHSMATNRSRELRNLGWDNLQAQQADRPEPVERVFPLSSELDHLLIDVEDRPGFRRELIEIVASSP